ncbi:hypothetical protein [Streptomyces sp. MH60]|uniref:hypothetical protein n=1 Tax=Streptomyces sp. MH60 TaxID=1940758 RepID=UPI000CEE9206|nr:hypothetical protein [Streptomyces sp. MH60]PPS89579.1 hypothetical protein BZZ08_01726 [Streptomyces sp. MH60]
MDPVNFSRLMDELRSVDAETELSLVEDLAPGHVLASDTWDRHIVTGLPTSRREHGAELMTVPVRHLHGGHALSLPFHAGRPVQVYAARASRAALHQVPVIPRCVIPEAPAVGDRVVLQPYTADRLGVGSSAFQFNGSRWQQAVTAASGHTEIRTFPTRSIETIVRPTAYASSVGWHVYLPAGHVPHLYADGRPVPARTADQLTDRDVILMPGGGRLQVDSVTRHADGRTLRLTVLTASAHTGLHLTWASREGDRIEVEDSGRQGLLYATEPRAVELRSAAELVVGDTVIAAWGTPYSNVATVEEIWQQQPGVLDPQRTSMHVHSTTVDGRPVRTQTGFDNRYLLLHRPSVDHASAPGVAALARSHV